MKKKNSKIYKIDGCAMQFNSKCFKQLCKDKSKIEKNMTVKQIEEEIGSVTGSAPSAVHTWIYGTSTPSDEYKIYDIAEYFDIDYRKLLVDVDTSNPTPKTEVENKTTSGNMQTDPLEIRLYNIFSNNYISLRDAELIDNLKRRVILVKNNKQKYVGYITGDDLHLMSGIDVDLAEVDAISQIVSLLQLDVRHGDILARKIIRRRAYEYSAGLPVYDGVDWNKVYTNRIELNIIERLILTMQEKW